MLLQSVYCTAGVQRRFLKRPGKGNTQLHFGSWGIRAEEAHWLLTARLRLLVLLSPREMKRGGKVFGLLSSQISQSPKEACRTRMGFQ